MVKEFTWDLWVEGDTIDSSLRDFAWYMVGTFAGTLWLKILKRAARKATT